MAEMEISFLRKRLLKIQQQTREEYDAIESTQTKSVDNNSSDDNRNKSEEENLSKPTNRQSGGFSNSSDDHSPRESNDGTSGYSSSNSVEPDYHRASISQPVRKPLPIRTLWSSEVDEELNIPVSCHPIQRTDKPTNEPSFLNEYSSMNSELNSLAALLPQSAAEQIREQPVTPSFVYDYQSQDSVCPSPIEPAKISDQWSIENSPLDDFQRNFIKSVYTTHNNTALVPSVPTSGSDQCVDDFVRQLKLSEQGNNPNSSMSNPSWSRSPFISSSNVLVSNSDASSVSNSTWSSNSNRPANGSVYGGYSSSILSSSVPVFSSSQLPGYAKPDAEQLPPNKPNSTQQWQTVNVSQESMVPVLQQYNDLIESNRNPLCSTASAAILNPHWNGLPDAPVSSAYLEPGWNRCSSPEGSVNDHLSDVNRCSVENDRNSVYEQFDNITNFIPRHPIPPLSGLIQTLQNCDSDYVSPNIGGMVLLGALSSGVESSQTAAPVHCGQLLHPTPATKQNTAYQWTQVQQSQAAMPVHPQPEQTTPPQKTHHQWTVVQQSQAAMPVQCRQHLQPEEVMVQQKTQHQWSPVQQNRTVAPVPFSQPIPLEPALKSNTLHRWTPIEQTQKILQNILNQPFVNLKSQNTQNDALPISVPILEMPASVQMRVSDDKKASAFQNFGKVPNYACNEVESRTVATRHSEKKQNYKYTNSNRKSRITCDNSGGTYHRNNNSAVCRSWEASPRESPRENAHYRKQKRIEYTPQEEERLAMSLKHTYECESLDSLLESCFKKHQMLTSACSWYSKRKNGKQNDMYKFEKWDGDKLRALQEVKQKLNSVKEKLSEFDLNEWHRHTRSTNPADLVMKRLRSDVKVEFLTQAWCKFYEILNKFHLIPKGARQEGKFYSIHLCEAPGAFIASLNHYLQLNYPELEWHWRANSLNPYYEGNHLSAMINDDRFMLQTIYNWDFGPDMTGDITHPDYPNYLREKCGDHLPHLVTADGSFDCQDKPEEQENSVSWLHLKETLTALNILRKELLQLTKSKDYLCSQFIMAHSLMHILVSGGHFVIKMFTFFECDTVCLMFVLKCVFESIDVFKPATSKEGNSEVYVVCRQYKNESVFKPYLQKLLNTNYEDHQKYAMFPFERIPRIFLDDLLRCSRVFAAIQMKIIERNIRLYPRANCEELRRQFEYVQEKLFEKYVTMYQLKPIPLNKTVVRIPYRKSEKRFTIPKVIEERDHKQGSHKDQVKRAGLIIKELVKKIVDEIYESLSSRIQKITVMPRAKLDTSDFDIKFGKPIEAIYSSQFCHGTYMRIRNELIAALGQAKYNLVMSDMKGSEMLKDDPDFCDFTTVYMLQSNYNKAQTIGFQKLYDRLKSLREHDNLKLFAFPALTQFNVSVLCILGQMFQEVCFEAPNKLYLRNLIKESHRIWMQPLDKIHLVLQQDKPVISILPIDCITGASNQFYSWIIEMNNARVLNEIDLTIYYYN